MESQRIQSAMQITVRISRISEGAMCSVSDIEIRSKTMMYTKLKMVRNVREIQSFSLQNGYTKSLTFMLHHVTNSQSPNLATSGKNHTRFPLQNDLAQIQFIYTKPQRERDITWFPFTASLYSDAPHLSRTFPLKAPFPTSQSPSPLVTL